MLTKLYISIICGEMCDMLQKSHTGLLLSARQQQLIINPWLKQSGTIKPAIP